MNDLLTQVLEAHGGMERWSRVSRIRSHWTIDGPFWGMKCWPKRLTDIHIEIDARRQWITIVNFTEPGVRATFDMVADRITIESPEGVLLEARECPLDSFAGQTYQSQWDRVHLAYFVGYAVWNYLASPFMFTLPGVSVEELDPWTEGDETWRRLQVTFPSTVKAHNTRQVFYFDGGFLMRRNDYVPHIMADVSGEHHSNDHRSFDGITVQTRRHVWGIDPQTGKRLMPDCIISIDVHSYEVETVVNSSSTAAAVS